MTTIRYYVIVSGRRRYLKGWSNDSGLLLENEKEKAATFTEANNGMHRSAVFSELMKSLAVPFEVHAEVTDEE